MSKNRSVIIGWVYSYIIILLIPIIAVFVNYHFNLQVVKNEIIRVNEQVLNNQQQNLDESLYDMLFMHTHILASPEYFTLISNKDMGLDFYIDVNDMVSSMKLYMNSDSKTSYMIYLKEKDYLLWGRQANLSEVCYEAKKFTSSEMPDYEKWNQFLNAEYDKHFFLTSYVSYSNSEPCIVYADTISFKEYEKANIFTFVPVSEIEAIISTLNDGTIMTLYNNGECIVAVNSEGITDITEEMATIPDGDNIFETASYVGVQKESEQKGVYYCLLTPRQEYWKGMRHIRNILIVSMLLTLLIGIVCIYFLINRNFKPLYELLLKTTGKKKQGNEFFQIENAFNDLDYVNKMMEKKILTQKEILQKNYLYAMMKGRYIEIQHKDEYMLHMKEDEAIVLVGFEIPLSDEQWLGQDNLLIFIIDNIFRELMENEKMYCIEDGSNLFYLFVIDDKRAEEWRNRCMEKINYLSDLLEEKWDVNLSAAISRKECNLDGIRLLYQDITEVFEYKDIVGDRGVIDTELMKDTLEILPKRTVGLNFEMALVRGDYPKLLKLSEEFFSNAHQTSLFVLRMQMLEVFQVIVEFVNSYEKTEGQKAELAGYLSLLLEAKDRDTMKMNFNQILTYVYQNVCDCEEDREIVVVVKEYIKEHYTDKSLNISTIADAIGNKTRYISRVFKEEAGEGILDYINVLRISKAKILLRTQKYTLEETSEKVGFASYKTFRRIFVKLTGVTPGKYCELYKENGGEE